MARRKQYEYPEDLFADTRMSFGDHLEELRQCLLRAAKGFLLAFVVSLFIGAYVVDFIKKPVEEALLDYHFETFASKTTTAESPMMRRVHGELASGRVPPALLQLTQPQALRLEVHIEELETLLEQQYPDLRRQEKKPKPEAQATANSAEDTTTATLTVRLRPLDFLDHFYGPLELITKRIQLTTLSAQEAFMVYIWVCLLTGFVLASPWVFYQLWAFVAAGLYPHEKRYVHVYLPFSVGLFLAGVAICQYWIIPAALRALLAFNRWMQLEPDLRLNEWLWFAILMPVVTGLCFQTPLVMMFLGKIGIFTAQDFATKRRLAIFVMLVFAAVVSPSVDMWSLMFLWLPMVALYELGIYLVKLTEEPPEFGEDEIPYQPESVGAGQDQAAP